MSTYFLYYTIKQHNSISWDMKQQIMAMTVGPIISKLYHLDIDILICTKWIGYTQIFILFKETKKRKYDRYQKWTPNTTSFCAFHFTHAAFKTKESWHFCCWWPIYS